ncbi:hypothetical protein [Natrinema halophilum]|uniref:Uncharacterized protein n=1 Tax=Natrinema halophilum TaxID=1699371 RepID=A0A7D5GFW8_9EURY|nr:hypothetical protein [Natrinema halophilum]QLG47887.1 hypothetical protein HYG82_03020 [Natrinema halophilum]UHQ96459.1 hypothetical protein HYG82_23335 [Natrinema halophilum]
MAPQEPQYELRDPSDGSLLGTIYANGSDGIAIHHAGSGDEVVLDGSGLTTPSLSTERVDTEVSSIGQSEHTRTSAFNGSNNYRVREQKTEDVSDSATVIMDNADDIAVNFVFGKVQGSSAGFADIVISIRWTSVLEITGLNDTSSAIPSRSYSKGAPSELELAMSDPGDQSDVVVRSFKGVI